MNDIDTTLKGTVKVWFDERGFGWIARDDGAPDIFLHISDLPNDYDFEPQRGDRVAFAVGADRKGRPTAVKATILDSTEAKDEEPTTTAMVGEKSA
jgi:CspA family cold shock protein